MPTSAPLLNRVVAPAHAGLVGLRVPLRILLELLLLSSHLLLRLRLHLPRLRLRIPSCPSAAHAAAKGTNPRTNLGAFSGIAANCATNGPQRRAAGPAA